MHESQNLEEATTAMETAPDAKTRRYDRQLRLWAASGQAALEASRILVISASATATSILKNLVLPGIGHFTVIDSAIVTPADAGNNFFLEGPSSIGKSRAEEAVRLLCELNEEVEGKADTRDIKNVLESDPTWIKSFSVVIAHNLDGELLDKLSELLWEDESAPCLVAVKSAGLIAEFFIQYHEHRVIESHSENTPTLRLDRPFPALRERALSLDFANMDITEHGHIPYVFILVRALEDWKASHDGNPPATYADRQEFKKRVEGMRRKFDEENFEEAIAQAYRVWSSSAAPSSITDLFAYIPSPLTATSPPFYYLLAALKAFVEKNGYLPLSAALPDMKADTEKYIGLQKMYKDQANAEKAEFQKLLSPEVEIPQEIVDSFVKNAHHVQILRGSKYGALDSDKSALANAIAANPKGTATHLALSALTVHFGQHPPKLTETPPNGEVSLEALTATAQAIAGELPEEFADEAGEIARAPTADLPNTAGFMGGLVAQEVIKMITKQYVPVNGYVVVDLVDTWTAVVS